MTFRKLTRLGICYNHIGVSILILMHLVYHCYS